MATEPRHDPASAIDPTTLTTASISREVFNVEKLLTSRIQALEKAVDVAHENLVRVPTDVDKAIGHLKTIVDERGATLNERFSTMLEKFDSVQTQFRERDTRTEQSAKDSKVAIDAALQAQKEAVIKQQEASDRAIAKAEAATSKQIEQITELIRSNTKGSDEKIDDLKQRLTRAEGAKAGMSQGLATLIAVGGVVVALVVGASTLLSRSSSTPDRAVQYVPSSIPVPVPGPGPK